MYVYTYVCMYVYTYVSMYECVCVCVCVYVYIYILPVRTWYFSSECQRGSSGIAS